MRLALISDIHGNDIALQAVLDDINQKGAEAIVCLGDVAALGPRPGETVRMIQDLDCPCIMGNHDAFMNDPELINSYTDIPEVVEAVDWCRDRLTGEDLSFIASFAPSLEIGLDNDFTMSVFHGTPQSYMNNLLAETPPDDLDRMLDSQTAQMAACGHTHVQMLRQHRGMLIVNPGSVGLPYQEVISDTPPVLLNHAEYAMVETSPCGISVVLCRVPVDRDALFKSAQSFDNPLRNWLLRQYS
jgi:predicted phosphodiesterase